MTLADPLQEDEYGAVTVDAAPLSATNKADGSSAAVDPLGLTVNGEYQVMPGDTLNSIALAVYADVTKASAILSLNQTAGRLATDQLQVYQLLLLP